DPVPGLWVPNQYSIVGMTHAPDALVIVEAGITGPAADRFRIPGAAPFSVLVGSAVPESDGLPAREVFESEGVGNRARGRIAKIEAVAECWPSAMEHALHVSSWAPFQTTNAGTRGERTWHVWHAGEVVQRVGGVDFNQRARRFSGLEKESVIVGECRLKLGGSLACRLEILRPHPGRPKRTGHRPPTA